MLFLLFMKILDKYLLKSFFKPFVATFVIVLFVLVMQALWQAFENIAGKGISLIFILKFLYYTTLMIIPQALPTLLLVMHCEMDCKIQYNRLYFRLLGVHKKLTYSLNLFRLIY